MRKRPSVVDQVILVLAVCWIAVFVQALTPVSLVFLVPPAGLPQSDFEGPAGDYEVVTERGGRVVDRRAATEEDVKRARVDQRFMLRVFGAVVLIGIPTAGAFGVRGILRALAPAARDSSRRNYRVGGILLILLGTINLAVPAWFWPFAGPPRPDLGVIVNLLLVIPSSAILLWAGRQLLAPATKAAALAR